MKISIERLNALAIKISIKKWKTNLSVKTAREYTNFANVLCVFQTFNKSHLIKFVLRPFVKNNFKNILLFADGCVDKTIQKASLLLDGKNHAVISVNNVHEIQNYRFAMNSEWGKTAEFSLLMQDDDIYPEDFSWLEYGLKVMSADPKLVVIGFAGGYDFLKMHQPSETYETDSFFANDGFCGIEDTWVAKNVIPTRQTKFSFQYCQVVFRAPHLIRNAEFLKNTNFDPLFEPYQDDDTNYCLDLWSKGFRVGLVTGAEIHRNIGIGGMRLSKFTSVNKRPSHTKRNYSYIYSRYADFINTGQLENTVKAANDRIVKKFVYL
jgi:hypothetical protein